MTSLTPFHELFDRTYDSSSIPRNFGNPEKTESYIDYHTVVKKGPAYIFEYAKELQPKFYNLIKECQFYVGEHHWQDIKKTKVMYFCFTVLNGHFLSIEPRYARNGVYKSYDYNLGLNPPRREKLIEALPESIAMAYYYRISSLGIAEEPPFNHSRLLGDYWHPFDTIASFHNISDWERYLPLWLPREPIERLNAMRMRSLLDTRQMGDANMIQLAMSLPDTTVKLPYGIGDQLMVDIESAHGKVYHLHRGRLDEPRVLMNSAEAIDAYVQHILLKRPEPFDFLPYSQTFKQAGNI
jgi:hypothetical protein